MPLAGGALLRPGSAAQGLAGVILDPLRGAEREGALGFVKGVGKGLTGLVVKPVAGVLDFTNKASEGVVNSAKALTGPAAGAAPAAAASAAAYLVACRGSAQKHRHRWMRRAQKHRRRRRWMRRARQPLQR